MVKAIGAHTIAFNTHQSGKGVWNVITVLTASLGDAEPRRTGLDSIA